MIKITVKKKYSTGEWVVRVCIDGKYDENKTYYTDDKTDAMNTANHMRKEFGL